MPRSEPCEVVVVTVGLDHHVGSTLLTNFYRTTKLNSNIINNNIEITNELIYHTKHDTKLISSPQLLYRGSRDGFKAEDFHSKCDNQGPTLTIIKSAEFNQIFGGFTTKNWKPPSYGHQYSSMIYGTWISDDLAFIFKIDENSSNQPRQQQQLFRKFNVQQGKEEAICVNPTYLAVFGAGYDFCIANDCNLNNKSYSNFGYTYELPSPSSS